MPTPNCLLFLVPVFVQAPLHTFHGDSPNDEFGVSVAMVGDTNRDGYADVLVGAHWDDNNGSNSGSARLFSGVDGAVLATLNGDAANDFFGLAVAGVGDIDFDGFEDFAVGSDSSNLGGTDAGLVRVFSGKTHTVLRNITGAFAGEQLGASLARVEGASDLLLVGAPASDRAIAVSASTGAIAWTFYGLNPGDLFGAAVASGRDLDGDGVPDYAIGAPNDDVGGTDTGSVTLFSGATGSQIRVLRGLAVGDRFGSSVALVPDTDGDGRGELVVGAPRANGPGNDAGAVYLYSGSSGSLIFARAGEAAGDQFGTAVASIATSQGNPEPAFVVGARLNDVGGANAGAAYVYSGLSGALLRTLRGHAPNDWFGGAVAGGGDVDGNGIGDILVSARLADVNGVNSGTVEVHASPLVPRTWYVDVAVTGPGGGTQANPYKSIQYAIDRPTTRSGDAILIASGNYFENLVIDSKILRLARSGIDRPVIDGQQQGPVMSILNNLAIGSSINGLTIRNGELCYPDPNTEDLYGAGVYAHNSCIEVSDCVVTENTTQNIGTLHGIGIYAEGPRIRIVNSQVTDNRALNGYGGPTGHGGGGIGVEGGDITIEDCLIRGNYSEMNGGGVSAFGSNILIRGCSIIENNGGAGGENGGGIYAGGGPLLIEACDISRNGCRDNGGGIAVSGQVEIKNCLIDGNGCGEGSYEGGGVYASTPGTTIEGCIISRNTNGHGGGTSGPVLVQDTSFVGNSANSSWDPFYCGRGGALHGGIALRCLIDSNNFGMAASTDCPGSAAADAALTECTIVNNSSPIVPGGYDSTLENCTVDSCIVWSNQGNFADALTSAQYSNIEGGYPGTGNIAADPLFIAAGHDYHLTAPSPCIDVGNPSLPLDPDGSRADMGAFPFDPNYCPPPFTYCTAKPNSCGQLPAISFTGSPHAGATSGFVLSTTGARAGRSGLVIYSPNGTASTPFQGGTLCVAPQGLRRGLPVLASGGSGGLACDAVFTIDWAAYGAGNLGGNPASFLNTLGQQVNAQWWGRDNQTIGALLSDAIQYEVCP